MINWKDIVGFEGRYQISDTGLVRCLGYTIEVNRSSGKYTRRVMPKMLKRSVNNFGYQTVELTKGKVFQVHRLVVLAFLPNPENKRTVNHIDGDKLNNSLSNLEWNTYSENIIHAYNTGLKKVKVDKEHHHFGKVRGKSINKKLVFDCSTGLYFDCLKDAADSLDMKYKTLSAMMTGQNVNKTNLIYA